MPLTVSPRALLAIIASAVLALGIALLAAPPAQPPQAACSTMRQLAEPAAAGRSSPAGLAWRCDGIGLQRRQEQLARRDRVRQAGQGSRPGDAASPRRKGALEGDELARCNQG